MTGVAGGHGIWLSVIMPTYNAASYLHDALDSVARQAGDDVEIVAVDDGSTDETVDILRSYQPVVRITIIAHRRRGNWVASTNDGLRAAHGRYACFLHQDDFWAVNRLEVLRGWCARFPDAVMFLHPVFFVDASGRRIGQWNCPLFPGRLLVGDAVVERLLVQNFVAVPSPLFRRERAGTAGGLDESLWYAADWDFWLKLAAAGPVVVCPEPLASFRVHRASQTSSRTVDGVEMRRQLEAVLAAHLPSWQARHAGNRAVARAARFSIEANLTLSALLHGQAVGWLGLSIAFGRLGPAGWCRYLRDSRVFERMMARLRLLRGEAGRGRR